MGQNKVFQRGVIVGVEPVSPDKMQPTIHGTLQIVSVNTCFEFFYEATFNNFNQFGFIPASSLTDDDIRLRIKIITWDE